MTGNLADDERQSIQGMTTWYPIVWAESWLAFNMRFTHVELFLFPEAFLYIVQNIPNFLDHPIDLSKQFVALRFLERGLVVEPRDGNIFYTKIQITVTSQQLLEIARAAYQTKFLNYYRPFLAPIFHNYQPKGTIYCTPAVISWLKAGHVIDTPNCEDFTPDELYNYLDPKRDEVLHLTKLDTARMLRFNQSFLPQ